MWSSKVLGLNVSLNMGLSVRARSSRLGWLLCRTVLPFWHLTYDRRGDRRRNRLRDPLLTNGRSSYLGARSDDLLVTLRLRWVCWPRI
jgi:hypothetical protein